MTKSILFYSGLILTIMGLIGLISGTGPEFARYVVMILGLALLLLSYVKRNS
jgi:hypothetical protein